LGYSARAETLRERQFFANIVLQMTENQVETSQWGTLTDIQ